MCKKDFRIDGQWEFVCSNGTWGKDYRESASRCVPMTTGELCVSIGKFLFSDSR